MSEQSNIQLVKDHFAAFGKQDIQAALSFVADQVDWQSPVTFNPNIKMAWAKKCTSKEEVAEFFTRLDQQLVPGSFEIIEFTAQGDRVVVEGRNKGTIRCTSNDYVHEWAMIFTIKNNKIIRHRHYYDTADILNAFDG